MTWITALYLWLAALFGIPQGPPPPPGEDASETFEVSFHHTPVSIDNGY